MKPKKTYRGEPGGEVRVHLSTGRSYPLRHVVLHSPTGFGWGYAGSGPADLALSLLCDVLGEKPTTRQIYWGQVPKAAPWDQAQPYYQTFKQAVVARWALGQAFEIEAQATLDWLQAQGYDPAAAPSEEIHEKGR